MDILEWVLFYVPRGLKPMLYETLCKFSSLSGNQHHYRGIYRLPMNLVLKVSSDPTGNEAVALQFVEALDGVHAPKLIDCACTAMQTYLLTTWIEGDTVADVWGQLTASDKAHLAVQLRDQVSSLHEQTHTRAGQRSISLASGSPIIDPRVPWLADNPRIFTTSPDLFQQLWIGLGCPWNADTLQPKLQPLIEREDVPIVFCHGDILRKNLILPGGLQRWRSGATVVCLIDWEYAGWMPLPWDPLKATWMTYGPEDEWFRMMKVVFTEAHEELEADWLWRSRSKIPIVRDWQTRVLRANDA
ncbi:protein kinase subdomain-containing protein PKL [Lentinus tigrinus ALCF2SS1-7]|uniref:Protein kinase subdomain-containing protein PKL n=1 Tax=Lentinus tigrinus ALCF2SS1-6 TaxID=1328759 RepID=A0A5C2SLV7_9APHY|nr:protein kinase subdomain-containing protein PKL [Lentinus tigrinus ALCF2SS1-6]RPD76321.1 protein kinase subdomain-containing protein PKL [Lentinus tigrinus ALCF2SS1-7]